MKKLLLGALGALLLLSGCAGERVWETVSDTPGDLVETVASAMGEEPYEIIFAVPDDAVLETFSQTETYTAYEAADGAYQIESLVLDTPDIDTVISTLTGLVPETVETIKTKRFSMPEYRFVWYALTEEGGRLCRASVLTDTEYSYALVFSAREDAGARSRACRDGVLSSFGLYTRQSA